MAQLLRPISEVTNDNSANAPNGHTLTDGTAPDSGDWWYGENNSDHTLEVLLTDLSGTPPASGTCTVTIYQAQADSDAGTTAPTSGGSNATYDVYVFEGATQRAARTGISCSESSFTADANLTFAASSITDWSTVRVRFISYGTGGSPSGRRAAAISYIEISAPDEAADTTLTADGGALTATGGTSTVTTALGASSGAITLTPGSATLSETLRLTADGGAITLTGGTNAFTETINLDAVGGTLTLAPASSTFTELFVADAGVLTLSPADATLFSSLAMTATGAALTLSPATATIAITLAAASEAITLTGGTANFPQGQTLTATSTALSLTGADASPTTALGASSSALNLTGGTQNYTTTLGATSAPLTLTPASAAHIYAVGAVSAALALTGSDATMDEGGDVTLNAQAGSLSMVGATALMMTDVGSGGGTTRRAWRKVMRSTWQ